METTVLVVDDHPGFRRCVRRLLEAHGYRVVGEAADGATAVDQAREFRPQLALVDVYLPDSRGFEVAERLTVIDPAITVILVSSHDLTELKPAGAATGARGFIPKEHLSREAIEELL